MSTDLSPIEIRRLEAQWKSDVDLRLDKLVAFADEYEALLRMLIERERQREKLRQAVIEKTLTGLILAGIVGLLSLAWAGLKVDFSGVVETFKGK